MRFDFAAYEKVFPEVVSAPQAVESAVDTFTPTSEQAKDNKPGEDLSAMPAEEKPAENVQIVTPEPLPALEPKGDENE